MSLAGVMIKNSIVLLDEIKDQTGSGEVPYDAVIDSAMGRLRPVVLAAATTVLGVMPCSRTSSGWRWRSPSWQA